MPQIKSTISPNSPIFKSAKFALAACLLVCGAATAGESMPGCRYPEAEHRAGIEGTVALGITVASDGSVRNAHVIQSSGNAELDRVAAVCAAKWHYKPAMKDGMPVEAQTQARVVWKLH